MTRISALLLRMTPPTRIRWDWLTCKLDPCCLWGASLLTCLRSGSNQDIEYFATVQIGNPPRDFRIIMDSGSADFWVGSETNCNSDKGTDGKTTDCVSALQTLH